MPYLLPALLFLVGLASVGGALFGRVRNRRIAFAVLGLALWAGAVLTLTLPPAPPAARGGRAQPTPERPTVTVASGPRGFVAFHSDYTGNFEIWRMRITGTGLQQLTNHPERDIEPAWSPDGSQIVFASGRDDPLDMELYLMNADGSEQRRLLESQPGDDWGPRWSPDGTRIVYQSNRDRDFEIYVVNADGTGRTNLTRFPQGNDARPDWSPDGTQIVFQSDRDGESKIYVMAADGSNQRRLTEGPGNDENPRWSPDGRFILFDSNREGGRSLYILPAEGGEPRRLTPPAFNAVAACWAMNGEWVLFSSDRDGDWEIYLIRADGTGLTRLTRRKGFDRWPDWTGEIRLPGSKD